MASNHHMRKGYARLLTLWPKDALRPNLPFTRAIEHRGRDGAESKPTSSPPAIATRPSQSPPNPGLEQAQINALFSLLENRYQKKYPLSARALQPTSNPAHYTTLMQEIERAPQKTWWQAKVDEWKMKIRWS